MKIYLEDNQLVIDNTHYTKGAYEYQEFKGSGAFDIRNQNTLKSITNGTKVATDIENSSGTAYASLDAFYTAVKDFFSN